LGDAFFFNGSRTRKADELVKLARELLAAKIAEVQQRVRTRLQSASIEQTLQDFQVRVDKVIKIMETRLRQIDVQVKAVTERKGIAFDLKAQAAEALEKLDADLATAETDLVTEQELLLTLVANTPEYQNQDKKVSLLKARAEDVSGRRNAALAVLQVKEKFSRELEAHEIAQRKMFAIQRLWILQLRAEAEERVVTFRSRLEAMQTMSDQEVAKHLTDMGAVIDQSNIEYMVMTQEACIKNVEDKFAQYPEHLRKIKEAQEAQAESITRAKEHMDEYVRMYKEQFGDEPDIGFFFKNPIGDEKSAGTPAAKKEQEASSVDDLLKL
jgi:hypothetical protein